MVLLGFCIALLCVGTASGTQAAAPSPKQSLERRVPGAVGDSPEVCAALARAFPDADEFVPRVIALSEAQRAELKGALRSRAAPRLWSYREARRAGVLLGRAVVDDVIGKSLPITYMLLLSPENRVRAVEVLTYRESHGGEVRRDRWRAQFAGADASTALKLGSDIRSIAGATMSCRALTDGVRDLLLIADALHHSESATPAWTAGPAATSAGPLAHEGLQVREQLLMGTLLELRVVTQDRARFDAAADAGFARVAELESLWSTWREDSEISRLNAASVGQWCSLSSATLELVARAKELGGASANGFAMESGAAVELWRRAEQLQRAPSNAEIAAALEASQAGAFQWDFEGGRARRLHGSARIDLGAIGKGAALDALAREFEARELRRALFNFGGQLLAMEGPQDGAGWPVQIRDPRPGATQALWELELRNASLATSADDQRGGAIDGLRFSHIIDPRTGRPAQGSWSCSVLARSATEADALSTACFVLGATADSETLTKRNASRLVLEFDGRILRHNGFPGLAVTP